MNDNVDSPLRGEAVGIRNSEFGMRNLQGSLPGEMEAETRPEGVDVSNHQGVVGWQRVAWAGIAFAIPKASEGAGFTDPYFVRNVQRARAVGILCGAYHFLSHDLPARTQADHFLEVLSTVGRPGLLLPAVDVEPDPSSSKALRNRAGGAYGTSYHADHMVRLLDDFLTYMRDGIGQNLMIYTYPDWWDALHGRHPQLQGRVPAVASCLPYDQHDTWRLGVRFVPPVLGQR